MEFTEETSGRVRVFHLSGKIMGGPETQIICNHLKNLISEGTQCLVMNFQDVKWINSSGIGAIIACLTTLRKSGGDIRFANLKGAARNYFHIILNWKPLPSCLIVSRPRLRVLSMLEKVIVRNKRFVSRAHRISWWQALLLFILVPTMVTGQWYIETFIGPVKIISCDVTIRQPDQHTALVFHNVAFSGEAFKEPLYYGIRAGTFLKKRNWLGLEIEFIHNKAYARTAKIVHVTGAWRGVAYDQRIPMRNLLRDFSFSHGANLALVNAVLQKRWRKIRWRSRLGFGVAIPHTESTFAGEHQEQFDLTFPATQIAFGFTLEFWRHTQILAEYKFSYNNAEGVRIAHGEAETQILAHHFVAGVGYAF
jgi:anti-sigma B factor antagonist